MLFRNCILYLFIPSRTKLCLNLLTTREPMKSWCRIPEQQTDTKDHFIHWQRTNKNKNTVMTKAEKKVWAENDRCKNSVTQFNLQLHRQRQTGLVLTCVELKTPDEMRWEQRPETHNDKVLPVIAPPTDASQLWRHRSVFSHPCRFSYNCLKKLQWRKTLRPELKYEIKVGKCHSNRRWSNRKLVWLYQHGLRQRCEREQDVRSHTILPVVLWSST